MNGLGIERRFTSEGIQFVNDTEAGRHLSGYAAVFDTWSEDLGGFRERIRPGAFAKTLAESDVRALYNHDSRFLLGRTSNGTLKLAEDDKGLRYELTLPETSYARDLAVSVERGDISSNSFAFAPVRDTWKDSYTKRELYEVQLFEISPVTFPAYPEARLSLRAKLIEVIEAAKEPHRGKLRATDRELIHEAMELLQSIFPETPQEKHVEDRQKAPVATTPQAAQIDEFLSYAKSLKEG